MNIKEEIKGKRILGIDFGLARVGTAVCDELHITCNPRLVLDFREEAFWDKLLKLLADERAGAAVVGVPMTYDGTETQLMQTIREFIAELKEKSGLPVYERDESYTSSMAVETMVAIGKKKKNRGKKGETDKIAAAIILREFLNSFE